VHRQSISATRGEENQRSGRERLARQHAANHSIRI